MATVTNWRMILKDYVEAYLREEHMELLPDVEVLLFLNDDKLTGLVLVKNLHLSCDPYMCPNMSQPVQQSCTTAFVPGSVITGYGVVRIVDSWRPDLSSGELIWGITGWEDYNVIKPPAAKLLSKISHHHRLG